MKGQVSRLLSKLGAESMTDRQGAQELLFRMRIMHSEITIVWADSAYAGQLVLWAKKYLNLTIEAVRRPPRGEGVRHPAAQVGGREVVVVDDAGPPPLSGLRAHLPVERGTHHLGAITLMTRRLTRGPARAMPKPLVQPTALVLQPEQLAV